MLCEANVARGGGRLLYSFSCAHRDEGPNEYGLHYSGGGGAVGGGTVLVQGNPVRIETDEPGRYEESGGGWV